MNKLPGLTPPFTGRQPLPPAFAPAIYALPAGIRAQLEAYCVQTGDDPGAVLADAVTLLIDELAGEVMDERELGFSSNPWTPAQPDLAPGSPGAPEPARGPHPATPAPPAQSGGAP